MKEGVGAPAMNATESDELPKYLQLIYFCVGLPLGLVICVGNVVFLAIVRDKKTCLKPATQSLFTSLVLSDICGGCVVIIHVIFAIFQPDIHHTYEEVCYLWALVLTLPLMSDIFHLSAICLERRHAIGNPANIMTKTKASVFCVLIWAYSAVLCAFGMVFLLIQSDHDLRYCDMALLSKYYLIILGGHVLVTMVTVVASFINIRSTLRHHQRKIQVTNTITYNNLLEDMQSSKPFFACFVFQIICILPLTVSIIVHLSLMTGSAITAVRICYLFAFLSGLKWVLCLVLDKKTRELTRKRFGCLKVAQHASPSHTN